MDLWIRSQDKTILTKVDNICIMENRIVFIPNRGNGRATLGKYKTNKRALEVLEEIQHVLIPKVIITEERQRLKCNYKLEMIDMPKVYEMPKE